MAEEADVAYHFIINFVGVAEFTTLMIYSNILSWSIIKRKTLDTWRQRPHWTQVGTRTCGWAIGGGKYRINWHSGPEAPTVLDIAASEEVDDEDERSRYQ